VRLAGQIRREQSDVFIRPAPIEIIACHTPSSRTPTGSKGMSEGSVIGALGAVTPAVNDKLAPLRGVVERQPLTARNIHALLEATPATMKALGPMAGS
jgi:carbon-monoxide dehydrogenase large subunit